MNIINNKDHLLNLIKTYMFCLFIYKGKEVRVNRAFNFKESTLTCVVQCLSLKNSSSMVSIIIILRALYRLALNDKMRGQLCSSDDDTDDDTNLSSLLSCVLAKGNAFEVYFALEVLAQLSFDADAAKRMSRDVELKRRLAHLSSDEWQRAELESDGEKKVYNMGVLGYLAQIDWNLNGAGGYGSLDEHVSQAIFYTFC